MSDSDDDLLELAGIGSDEESDYEPVTKKRSRPAMGAIDDDEDDEDDDIRELDVNDDPYPLEGKYKNQADKDQLMAMDEMTRESILYERIQEKEKFRERKFLALRARQSKVESKNIKTGSSSKKLKTSKLSELKRQRERKNNKESGRGRDDEYMSVDEDEDDDDDEDLRELAGYDDDDRADEYYSDDYAPSSRSSRSRGGYDQSQYQEASFEQLDKIRSSRSVLEKYLYRDEFDTCVVGTLVRVNIGPSRTTNKLEYRIALVEEVKRGGRPYKLSGKPCNTYLKISQGDSSTIMDISYLSNSPFTREEFEMYKKRIADSTNKTMPTVRYVNDKFEELKQMATRPLTDMDINKMIAKKDKLSVNEMNTANTVKKLGRLKEEYQVALEQHNEPLIQKLKTEIEYLSTFFQATTSASKLEQINLRNQKSNQEFIRKAEKKSAETRRKQLQSNDFSDPFSRLRTNPKVFYKSAEKQEDTQKAEEEIVDEKAEKNKIKNSIFRREGIDALIKQIDIKFDFDLQA